MIKHIYVVTRSINAHNADHKNAAKNFFHNSMFINQKLQKIENHILNVNARSIGKLYIVSTPIGNIKDITIRALDVLKFIDKVICEDTRVTSKLLMAYQINKPMVVYNDHSSIKEQNKIINYLLLGQNMALISDAGTPLISDPGYRLINAIIEKGIEITALPGPCAAITALTLSGLATDNFTFVGFLPNTKVTRMKKLESLKNISSTLIFFESSRRLLDVLIDFQEVFSNRRLAVARELTKIYEEVRRGCLVEQIQYWQSKELKGEFVIVLEAGPVNDVLDDHEIAAQMKLLLQKMSLKEAAMFAKEYLGINKKKVYEIALNVDRDMS